MKGRGRNFQFFPETFAIKAELGVNIGLKLLDLKDQK